MRKDSFSFVVDLKPVQPLADAQGVPVRIDWACGYCGFTASTWAEITDEIQCPMCGEPVVPQANNAGGN